MQSYGDNKYKNCLNCNETVFDLRSMSKDDIEKWYKEQNTNACVFLNTNQLSQNHKKKDRFFNLKNTGIASLLIAGSLLSSNLYAQENTKADSYIIEQTKGKYDSITITGKVKIKGLLNWKKLNDYSVNVYSKDLLIREVLINNKGEFNISLKKKEFSDQMSISIHSLGYKSIRIEDIEVKNTMLRVYMSKYKNECGIIFALLLIIIKCIMKHYLLFFTLILTSLAYSQSNFKTCEAAEKAAKKDFSNGNYVQRIHGMVKSNDYEFKRFYNTVLFSKYDIEVQIQIKFTQHIY